MPKMCDELAAWWPLLSPPEGYEEEAVFCQQTIEQASQTPIHTAGTGQRRREQRFASEATLRPLLLPQH